MTRRWHIDDAPTSLQLKEIADAHGKAPSIPFWRAEAPSRTAELSNVHVANQRRYATAFFVQDDWRPSDRLTINLGLRYDYMTVNYDNFRDARYSLGRLVDGVRVMPETPLLPGTEPLYKLNANIIQFFISAYF